MTHHPVPPTTQLEIAAHWLREAAIAMLAAGAHGVAKGDRNLRENLTRVADECERVAKCESTKSGGGIGPY